MEKKSILIVEDDGVMRELIKSYLEREYNIFEASRYSEAINQPIELIDLALIDYVLPERRNGFEVLRAVREVKPSLQAIIMTAYSNEDLAIKAMRAKATDYIKKPPGLAHLKRKLSEILEGNGGNEHPETIQSREEFIMEGIAAYIEDNYMEDLTLERLAGMACMNIYKFSKIFNERTGQSLPSYLNRIRIKKAAELLMNHDLSITEIALEVGYKSVEHFIRLFREVYGVSPRGYRKRERSKGDGSPHITVTAF
ncbi:MAG: hypothetical protein OHK0032_12870 [Thermodesulfovibrionales bacterium]